MSATNWRARTVPDLIIEVWEYLDCESVGARELESIQKELSEKFGAGAMASPASIARMVADEGAVLRHPEIFQCDLKWRRERMEQRVLKGELDFSDLSAAFKSVVKIEELRLQTEFERGSGEKGRGAAESRELRDTVVAAQEELLLRARSKIFDADQRRQAKEISEWLGIWLKTPELFSDWLDLRRRSPEFRKKFPPE